MSGAAGERAGKGLSAKIMEMTGLAGVVAMGGGGSQPRLGHMHVLPMAWSITAVSDLLDCYRDQQGKLPTEPTQTEAGEVVSSRKPSPCRSTWVKGKFLQRDPKTALGSLKSPLEASSSTSAHCLMGEGLRGKSSCSGERGRTSYPVGRVQQVEEQGDPGLAAC